MNENIFSDFKNRLLSLGLTTKLVNNSGALTVSDGTESLDVSLEKILKLSDKEKQQLAIDHLTETVSSFFGKTLVPAWAEAKNFVFLYLLPANYTFENIIHYAVTTEFHKGFVYYHAGSSAVISRAQLTQWGIDEATLTTQADLNMNTLLESSKLRLLQTDSHERIAILETPAEDLQSALIFCKNLRHKVITLIGFPLYCAIPVRNSCYFFSEQNIDAMINLLAETITESYQESDAKITTEILRISENGIQAIGKYQL